MTEPQQIFCNGAVFGFILAVILGFAAGQIRTSRVRMGQRNLPMDRFPDASQQSLTSLRVVRGSCFGCFGVIFWILILLGAIGIAYYYLSTYHGFNL